MRSSKIQILIISILFIGVWISDSCKPDWDFNLDKLSDSIGITPTIAGPVVSASLTLKEIIPTTTDSTVYIKADANNLIHVYAQIQAADMPVSQYFGSNPISGQPLPQINTYLQVDKRPLQLNYNSMGGDFYVYDPRIQLIVTSNFNFPVNFLFNYLIFFKKDGITSINYTEPSPNILNKSLTITSGTQTVTIDSTNSNVPKIISSLPEYISFRVNLNSVAGTAPTIPANARFKAILKIDVPFNIRINNFILQDIQAYNMQESFDNRMDDIVNMQIKVPIENGLPVSVYPQIYFADQNEVKLDSLFTSANPALIEGGGVNTDGKVINPKTSTLDIQFDQAKIKKIKGTKFLIIKAKVATSSAASNQNVKIFSTDGIKVKVGIKVQMKVTNRG